MITDKVQLIVFLQFWKLMISLIMIHNSAICCWLIY